MLLYKTKILQWAKLLFLPNFSQNTVTQEAGNSSFSCNKFMEVAFKVYLGVKTNSTVVMKMSHTTANIHIWEEDNGKHSLKVETKASLFLQPDTLCQQSDELC